MSDMDQWRGHVAAPTPTPVEVTETAVVAVQGRVVELSEQLRQEQENNLLLAESVTELESRLSEPGWRRMVALGDIEFSPEGRSQITAICRLMAIKNPLIKRGLNLRTAYVWGQGVEITAKGTGDDGQQDVNAVVQTFLDDNQTTVGSQQGREQIERSLFEAGNTFLALFTSPMTGRVQVRTIPSDEVADIICNPEDRSERWYYQRRWIREEFDIATGQRAPQQMTTYYPDVSYRPRVRPRVIGDAKVQWDAPVIHTAVNMPDGWLFGVPDSYAAVDWARAYKEFLEDWATLVKALSRFAWRTTTPASKRAAVKSKLASAPSTDPVTGEPRLVGANAVMTPGMMLEAIPKSGATIDAESGRPLAMMVAAALDVPVTMLLGDPGQTGARATAETLDQPTELAMQQRRNLWSDMLRKLFGYVVDQAVKAPKGPLQGTIKRDEYDREVFELAGDTDRTVDVTWPDLDDLDPLQVVEAIVKADQTGKIPALTVARLLLVALGVRDVDAVLEELMDEQGNFVPPDVTAGQVAVDAFRRGQDPAALLSGGQPDDEGEPTDGDQS